MKVLIACEFSAIVRQAFRRRGHDAWSCDLLASEVPGPHFQEDVRGVLDEGWDMMIAHPPCTYLTNSGVRWLYENGQKKNGKDLARWINMHRAVFLFRTLLNAPIPRICIENPVPHGHAKLPPFTQSFQPWQFGHGEIKRTCLWLKGLPKLVPTNIVEGRKPRVHHMSPGPERQKERSRFFRGVAEAMAEQWGDL